MHNQTNPVVLSEKRPRELRNNCTDAEKKLWRHLQNRQIHGAKFRRQHALADYIVDFVSFDAMVVFELDGGQHSEQAVYDQRRDAALARLGFKVIRVWNNELIENFGGVMDAIYFAVEKRVTLKSSENHLTSRALHENLTENHPHPSPPLEGEGVLAVAQLVGEGMR